jgi:hypothetical protein
MNHHVIRVLRSFVLVCLVLCNANQQVSAQDNHRYLNFLLGEYQNNLAREEAWSLWQSDSSDLFALSNYIYCSIETGQAQTALPAAFFLKNFTNSIYDHALYVRCLLAAGQLELAQKEARILLAGQSSWGNARGQILYSIDGALDRTYNVEFDFDVSQVDGQNSLFPYIHVPIPILSLPSQTATVVDSDAVNWPNPNIYQLVDGQRYLNVLPSGNTVSVSTQVTVGPRDLTLQCNRAPNGYPTSLARFTKPSHFINSDSQQVKLLANSLGRNRPYETVKAVLGWCQENIMYTPPGLYFPSGIKATDVMDRGFGHCEERIMVAVALLRANNIPARLLRGHSAFLGDDGRGHHHSILEFYLEGVGWIPWDYGQTPGVVPANFLAMFRYNHPCLWPEKDMRMAILLLFQRTGLNCEYVWFEVTSRQ